MPSDEDIISDIIKREGGVSNAKYDKGGFTFEGISSIDNPDLFVRGLPTDAQVRQRYEERYIKGPGFDKVADARVKSLLVDWGVNSGPAIAIQALQGVVGAEIDGVLGPETLAALVKLDSAVVINGLVSKRVQMIGRIVSKNPTQVRFLNGWLNRALEWLQ